METLVMFMAFSGTPQMHQLDFTAFDPIKPDQIQLSDGLYERGVDGLYRKIGNGVPEVTPIQTFRAVQRQSRQGQQWEGHSCPTCGYDRYPDTYVQRGSGPIPGTHIHQCPRDGTTWFH